MRKPPPTPKNPVMVPTIIPSSASSRGDTVASAMGKCTLVSPAGAVIDRRASARAGQRDAPGDQIPEDVQHNRGNRHGGDHGNRPQYLVPAQLQKEFG